MLIEIGQWMAEGFDRENDPMHEISANKIKQQFHLSASTAKKHLESLQNAGVVSPPSGTRPRQIDRNALDQFLQRRSNEDLAEQ